MLASPTPSRPGKPSIEVIALGDIECPEVLATVAAWRKWRGLHATPPREKLVLRDLGIAAAHISLTRVLDNGEDYEFVLIGEAHAQAYGTSYQHKNLSDVLHDAPRIGKQLKASYDFVRISRQPFTVRGQIGYDATDTGFAWFETCYLPFGSGDVDHILNTAVYGSRHAE